MRAGERRGDGEKACRKDAMCYLGAYALLSRTAGFSWQKSAGHKIPHCESGTGQPIFCGKLKRGRGEKSWSALYTGEVRKNQGEKFGARKVLSLPNVPRRPRRIGQKLQPGIRSPASLSLSFILCFARSLYSTHNGLKWTGSGGLLIHSRVPTMPSTVFAHVIGIGSADSSTAGMKGRRNEKNMELACGQTPHNKYHCTLPSCLDQ